MLIEMIIGDECELGVFSINEDPSCECCGTLHPYDITWSDGETWWCLDCAIMNKSFEITEEFSNDLLAKQNRILIEYYEGILINLTEKKLQYIQNASKMKGLNQIEEKEDFVISGLVVGRRNSIQIVAENMENMALNEANE
jgi:hypothetical protein